VSLVENFPSGAFFKTLAMLTSPGSDAEGCFAFCKVFFTADFFTTALGFIFVPAIMHCITIVYNSNAKAQGITQAQGLIWFCFPV
jgi:hypothetical protein